MRHSYLLSQLFRHKWLIQPQIALEMGGWLHAIYAGSLEFDEQRPPLGALAITPTGSLVSLDQKPEEVVSVFDMIPEGSTVIIPLKGSMLKESTWCSYGTQEIGSLLTEAGIHKNVKSIILDIDSGGGSVDSVPPMLDSIAAAQSHKPVVAVCDLCASAAMWTASKCDLIIASNDISSEFGSVGVMMSFYDTKPYYERMGFKFHSIYSNESSQKNQPFEMALLGKYDMIKAEELDPLARRFQADMRKNRKGKIDITVPGILNGKMFYARDAVKNGLADEIGNMDFAIKRAAQMANNYKLK